VWEVGVRNVILLICTALCCVSVGGCSHRAQPATGEAGAREKATVRVVNQGFPDMNIYVLSSGQRIRLGTVTGNSSSTLTIPDYLVGGLTPLRFLASPVGGVRAPVSEEITVRPGDEVVLTIPPGP
jgi:hypothetical protein